MDTLEPKMKSVMILNMAIGKPPSGPKHEMNPGSKRGDEILVDRAHLLVQTVNFCQSKGFYTLGNIREHTENELRDSYGADDPVIADIKSILRRYRLTLKKET